ncbi:MAG: 7TM diverse intracellular signaling domain-containing protein [Bacteroidota bacterium]
MVNYLLKLFSTVAFFCWLSGVQASDALKNASIPEHAAPEIIVSNLSTSYCLESSMLFLPYSESKWSRPEAAMSKLDVFTDRHQTNFKDQKLGLWAYFRIRNATDEASRFYLNGKLYDYVTLYRIHDNDRLQKVTSTGYLVPFKNKPVKDWDANLFFSLNAGESGVYLVHLQSVTDLSHHIASSYYDLCISLYPQASYEKDYRIPRFLLYSFLGGVLIIALYHFSLSISSNFREYWLFALFNLGVFLSVFFLTAQPYELEMIGVFSFERTLRYLILSLTVLAYLSFIFKLIDLKTYHPKLERIVSALLLTYPGIFLLLLFSQFKLAYFVFLVSVPLLFLTGLILAFLNYYQRIELRFFVIGNLFLGITGAIHLLANFEVFSQRVGITSNMIGILAEIVVFSFAITKKFSTLNQKKLWAEFQKERQGNQLKAEKKLRQQLEEELEEKSRNLASASIRWININEKLTELEKKLKKKLGEIDPEASKELTKHIDQIKTFKDHWKNFKIHFEQVHPHFFRFVRMRYPKLSKNDTRLLAFMKMQLSNKEIGVIMNVTKRSVEQAKRRMRIKMDLSPEADIIDAIESMEGYRSTYDERNGTYTLMETNVQPGEKVTEGLIRLGD